jgi:putative transposase
LFDAHRDDPEFGYRFLVDEARRAGEPMAERTAWRVCSHNGWWSAFGKKKRRGKTGRIGPPVHDDGVLRDFSAAAPNRPDRGRASVGGGTTAAIPAARPADRRPRQRAE